MMKKLFAMIIWTSLMYSAYSQNIGLRGNTEFSDNRRINPSIGFGGYLNINDFSEKFELLFSLDFNLNSKTFSDEGFESTYARFYFSTSVVYVLPLAEKLKIKIGPSISYNRIEATEKGIILRWMAGHKINSIGAELMANIHFQEIFKLPINLDIFITPTYLIHVKIVHGSSFIKDEYSDNLKILNLQLGISYKMIK